MIQYTMIPKYGKRTGQLKFKKELKNFAHESVAHEAEGLMGYWLSPFAVSYTHLTLPTKLEV